MSQDIHLSREEREALIADLNLVFRLQGAASDGLDEAIADHLGLNRTDHRCLEIIERMQPLTAGQLATEAGLTSGAVTAVLDRLERAGYARRVRDTEDRRVVRVEVVPDSAPASDELYGPLIAWSREQLTRASDEQLSFLRGVLVESAAFMNEHAARVRALPRTRHEPPAPRA